MKRPPVRFGVSLLINNLYLIATLATTIATTTATNEQLQHQYGNNDNQQDQGDPLAPIYLDSMDDLEHVAYLSLRNFNMTDEGLLQSSWLMGLSNALIHRQHQKVSASSPLSASDGLGEGDQFRDKLALMLESFISHLRNGHLRRAQLDELEMVVANLNASRFAVESQVLQQAREIKSNESSHSETEMKSTSSSTKSSETTTRAISGQRQPLWQLDDSGRETESSKRCSYLVKIYEFELRQRHRNMLLDREARMEYETVSLNGGPMSQQQQQSLPVLPRAGGNSDQIFTDSTSETSSYKSMQMLTGPQSPEATSRQPAQVSGGELPLQPAPQLEINTQRLGRLCRLVVDCQSAEDFVRLLGGQWRSAVVATLKRMEPEVLPAHQTPRQLSQRRATGGGHPNGEKLEQNEADEVGNLLTTRDEFLFSQQKQQQQEPTVSQNNKMAANRLGQTKTLRDSLSLSLAKLCPLILFQLHEEDGLCMVRRDDRPPMITVWGFATLFVTIVCFCSLIGLSITPLLGPTATANEDESSTSSSNSELDPSSGIADRSHLRNDSPHDYSGSLDFASGSNNRSPEQQQSSSSKQQDYRASLTLFEGLAVGSLVGSALFSLIPQAFELQERESNQGFLLKAFIIFMGIYLFFCSERIMRIILDTRHKHKKSKRLNHRSSNSLQMPSATGGEFERQQQTSSSSRHKWSTKTTNTTSPRLEGVYYEQQVGSSAMSLEKKSRKSVTLAPKQQVHSKITPQKRGLFSIKSNHPTVTSSFISSGGGGAVTSPVNLNANTALAANQLRAQRRSRRRKSRQQQLLAAKRRKQLRQQQRRHLMDPAHKLDSQQQQVIKKPSRSSTQLDSTSTSSTSNSSNHSSSSNSSLSTSPVANRWGQQMAAYDMSDEEEQFGDYDLGGSSGDERDYVQDQNNLDSDDDEYDFYNNNAVAEIQQVRAVNRKMTEYSKAKYGDQRQFNVDSNFHNDQHYGFRVHPDQSRFDFSGDSNYNRSINQFPGRHRPDRYRHHQRSGSSRNYQQAKREISTVAWMIVLGDGLHNFIDGISIGAAFSESILSGVSISVAVICEEFPHELGDFAVLVSSGMTVRQALGYNFLSACTCYFGMAVGIILGDVNDGASYISALAAGVFLYIALVDMMGELSATLEDTSRESSIAKTLKLLLLQNIGIFIGISIIFVLSFIDF